MNNQHQVQNYYFFVKVHPIMYKGYSLKQKSNLKQFRISIFKGIEKLSEQKIQINSLGQLHKSDNKGCGCYFNLLNYSHRRPVQCIIKFFQKCSQNQQKQIFQHKLYSYQLVNNFLTKKQNVKKENITTGFETEFLIQTFIQQSKQQLQQLVQSQKQNHINIKVSQQKDSQKKGSNTNKKDFSLLIPQQEKPYISKSESSTPLSFKLGLFQSFADEQNSQKKNRPRFFSNVKSDQSSQLWSQKKSGSIITTQPQEKKINQIQTEMDKYIGYHLQKQLDTRSNRSKLSFSSSKKSKNTIIRSFKKVKTLNQKDKIVQSPEFPSTEEQNSIDFQSQMYSQLEYNWQDQSKKTKMYYLGLIFVVIGLLYYLLADGGNQIYNKKKLNKKKARIIQEQNN